MDGPVVSAARQALDTGDVNHLLPWVAAADEPAVKSAFQQARAVRALGPDAKELADRWFFETTVRLHRASEGEPYTGLKPAGTEVEPAVAAADRALAAGSDSALIAELTEAMQKGVAARFAEAREAQRAAVSDVAARRRGVHAYVEFVHYVEGVHDAVAGQTEAGDDGSGRE